MGNVDKALRSDPENYRKWQEAMERGKDYKIETIQRATEGYLVEITDRLFDVIRSLEALQRTCNLEKIDLVRYGRSFAYQQGILDVVTELHKYATGERRLEEDIKDMTEAIAQEVGENRVKKSMYVEGMFQ